MYTKLKEKITNFLAKDIDKKSKYINVLNVLEKKIEKSRLKNTKEALREIKSLEKLKSKTKLMIDSLS